MDETKDVDEFVKETIDVLQGTIISLSYRAAALKILLDEKNEQKPKKKVRQPPKYV